MRAQLQGPPGTGKTAMLSELIDRHLFFYPNDKILVCAPSNAAVDQLVYRTSKVVSKELINLVRIGKGKGH